MVQACLRIAMDHPVAVGAAEYRINRAVDKKERGRQAGRNSGQDGIIDIPGPPNVVVFLRRP